MKRIGLLSLALTAALTVACNSNSRGDIAANNNTDNTVVGTAGENSSAFTDRDKDFINEMSMGGMADVELGKLASERGLSADVKQFGQMMVTDHTKAGDELKQVASRFNMTPANGIDDEHRQLRDKLMKLQGAEFDREYMNAMVDGHQDVADSLESRVDQKSLGDWKAKWEAATSHDVTLPEQITPEHSDNMATFALNQWAAAALPTVNMHLDRAKTLHDKLDKRGRNATE
jgi:putative membrane protein